jgi:hypothetical protein
MILHECEGTLHVNLEFGKVCERKSASAGPGGPFGESRRIWFSEMSQS